MLTILFRPTTAAVPQPCAPRGGWGTAGVGNGSELQALPPRYAPATPHFFQTLLRLNHSALQAYMVPAEFR